eukprot:TRINITY_DN356_c0_g1_i3.p1 TRINITY_DN356_c0_g1~~TRINITY_DN356_c0_g1_i3.p1  ORF type:complete len:389 (+),score=25.67 TRINITY_DN356_c0_g1_i3:183-1349(+)
MNSPSAADNIPLQPLDPLDDDDLDSVEGAGGYGRERGESGAGIDVTASRMRLLVAFMVGVLATLGTFMVVFPPTGMDPGSAAPPERRSSRDTHAQCGIDTHAISGEANAAYDLLKNNLYKKNQTWYVHMETCGGVNNQKWMLVNAMMMASMNNLVMVIPNLYTYYHAVEEGNTQAWTGPWKDAPKIAPFETFYNLSHFRHVTQGLVDFIRIEDIPPGIEEVDMTELANLQLFGEPQDDGIHKINSVIRSKIDRSQSKRTLQCHSLLDVDHEATLIPSLSPSSSPSLPLLSRTVLKFQCWPSMIHIPYTPNCLRDSMCRVSMLALEFRSEIQEYVSVPAPPFPQQTSIHTYALPNLWFCSPLYSVLSLSLSLSLMVTLPICFFISILLS